VAANQIAFIRQFKGRSSVVYDLEFNSKDLSKAVRAKYGTYWRKRNRPTMPGVLQGVSISLKEIAKRHSESIPGLQCFVTNYLPRPTLKLRDKGSVKSFGYVDAIRRFGHHLSNTFLTSQTKFAKTNVPVDELLPTFLVLSPDLLTAGNALDLSIVANTGDSAATDQDMGDQNNDDVDALVYSTPVGGSTKTGKGEKRKVSQKPVTSKKAATSYFG